MAESVAAIRVRLGPVGVWLSEFMGAAAARGAAQHLERLGYASLWWGEVVPRVLAALRPKMLELAGARTFRAHHYFVPPAHTPLARRIFEPDRLLILEQAVILCTDAVEARRRARAHLAVYPSVPNYTANLREFGYGDDDLSGQGSDRPADAIVAWGDERAIARRVSELRSSGAYHVLVHPLAESLAGALEHLASALLA